MLSAGCLGAMLDSHQLFALQNKGVGALPNSIQTLTNVLWSDEVTVKLFGRKDLRWIWSDNNKHLQKSTPCLLLSMVGGQWCCFSSKGSNVVRVHDIMKIFKSYYIKNVSYNMKRTLWTNQYRNGSTNRKPAIIYCRTFSPFSPASVEWIFPNI